MKKKKMREFFKINAIDFDGKFSNESKWVKSKLSSVTVFPFEWSSDEVKGCFIAKSDSSKNTATK